MFLRSLPVKYTLTRALPTVPSGPSLSLLMLNVSSTVSSPFGRTLSMDLVEAMATTALSPVSFAPRKYESTSRSPKGSGALPLLNFSIPEKSIPFSASFCPALYPCFSKYESLRSCSSPSASALVPASSATLLSSFFSQPFVYL